MASLLRRGQFSCRIIGLNLLSDDLVAWSPWMILSLHNKDPWSVGGVLPFLLQNTPCQSNSYQPSWNLM